MNWPSLGLVVDYASRASGWLVLAYLVVAATPPILFCHRMLAVIGHLNLLDGSWVLDSSFKASGGIWFGRDVAFTYGPLFQWLSSAPSRWIGVSTGTVSATWYTLPLYLAILATFLTARLLLPEVSAWRRALLVLLAVVFWSQDLRPALCLLAFAVFVRLTDGAIRHSAVGRGIGAALICAAAFLISADTGLYSVASLLLCIIAAALSERAWRQMSILLLSALTAFGMLVLAINAAMFSPLNFRFWRSSLAISTGYRWFEPARMAKGDKHLLFAILAMGLVVFLMACLWRGPRRHWSARGTFLLAGFGTALLMTQSAMVRSDYSHIRIGIYPLVFLCGVIIMGRLATSRWMEFASAAALVVLTVVAFQPSSVFRPDVVMQNVQQVRRPVLVCPAGDQLVDAACLSENDGRWLASLSGFVRERAPAESKIAVLSYETAVGLLSRHQVAGGVMQSYLVNGDYLAGLELQGLERDRPLLGLYFPESASNPSLDSVPALTRSPELWLYYLRHYRLADRPMPDVVGLVRDDSREQRIHSSARAIGAPSLVTIGKRTTVLDLGKLQWPSDGADFLKLRVQVDYPFWWRLRKPSCYVLRMTFADGSERAVQFVVQPGHDTDIWIFPWDNLGLANYFAADASQWRAADRPVLTAAQLIILPFDWLSVVPERVAVRSIEAVRVDLQ